MNYQILLASCHKSASSLNHTTLITSLESIKAFLREEEEHPQQAQEEEEGKSQERFVASTTPTSKCSPSLSSEIRYEIASSLLRLDTVIISMNVQPAITNLDDCFDLCGLDISLHAAFDCLREAETTTGISSWKKGDDEISTTLMNPKHDDDAAAAAEQNDSNIIAGGVDDHKTSDSISASSSLLLPILITPSSVMLCLRTIQRILLPEKKETDRFFILVSQLLHSNKDNDEQEEEEEANENDNRKHMMIPASLVIDQLSNMMVLFPIKAAASCHAMMNRNAKSCRGGGGTTIPLLPLWATRSRYPRMLIAMLMQAVLSYPPPPLSMLQKKDNDNQVRYTTAASSSSVIKQLFQNVLSRFMNHGACNDVVLGMHRVWQKRQRQHDPYQNSNKNENVNDDDKCKDASSYSFGTLIFDSMNFLPNPKDAARLIHSCMQYGAVNATCEWNRENQGISSSSISNKMGFVKDVVLPVISNSDDLRRNVFRSIVLSSSSSCGNTFESSLSSSTAKTCRSSSGEENNDISCFIPRCMAILLAECQNNDDDNECQNNKTNAKQDKAQPPFILIEHLLEAVEVWCEPVFISRTDSKQQHHITEFILQSLIILGNAKTAQQLRLAEEGKNNQNQSPEARVEQGYDYELVITALVRGVTARLESGLEYIRKDGMRVAESFAPLVGQTLRFEELHEPHNHPNDDRQEQEHVTNTIKMEKKKKKKHNKNSTSGGKIRETPERKTALADVDPDEDFISDEDSISTCSSSSFLSSDAENDNIANIKNNTHHQTPNKNDEYSSSGDDWSTSTFNDDDDEFIPQNLTDDEEDLRPIPRPTYLRECLSLLRDSSTENDKTTHDRHETVLTYITPLIQSRPSDLPDVCLTLTKELLHMENKFDLPRFIERRFLALGALTSCEPAIVVEYLVGSVVFIEGGVSMGTRFMVLDLLCYAAEELSGEMELLDHRLEQRKNSSLLTMVKQRVSGKRHLVPHNPNQDTTTKNTNLQSKTRTWGKLKHPQSTTLTVTNQFGPLSSSVFFYPLLHTFLQSKSNATLWGRYDGAKLLSKLLLTLSCFVKSSGCHPTTNVIAFDLFGFVWTFRDAESADVRQAVLVSLATCVVFLSFEDLTRLMLGCRDGDSSSLPEFLVDTALKDSDVKCRELALMISKHVKSMGAAIEHW